jgi:hypothetical protein
MKTKWLLAIIIAIILVISGLLLLATKTAAPEGPSIQGQAVIQGEQQVEQEIQSALGDVTTEDIENAILEEV